LVGSNATLLNVFLVEVPEMISVVVTAIKRIMSPATLCVVASIGDPGVVRAVSMFVMTVQVGATLKGLITAWEKAHDRTVTVLL
jgi:hypothetical protein